MSDGYRFKVSLATQSILWAVEFGNKGLSLALSGDQSFLIAGS